MSSELVSPGAKKPPGTCRAVGDCAGGGAGPSPGEPRLAPAERPLTEYKSRIPHEMESHHRTGGGVGTVQHLGTTSLCGSLKHALPNIGVPSSHTIMTS